MVHARKTARKAAAALLSLVLVLSLLPATALAAGGDEDGLVLDKTAELQPDGTYTLTLEAYATGKVTNVTKQVPTDVVLVLDVSGSMDEAVDIREETGYFEVSPGTYGEIYNDSDQYYVKDETSVMREVIVYRQWIFDWFDSYYVYTLRYRDDDYNLHTIGQESQEAGASLPEDVQFYKATYKTSRIDKIDALKASAKAFVDATVLKNSQIDDPADRHKIAIVKFASDENEKTGNDYMASGYNYTQIVQDLTTVSADNAQSMKDEIDLFRASGATSADRAMNRAKAALGYDASTGSVLNDGRNKVVVFFTDGEPTHSSNYDGDVAHSAVNGARDLKAAGVTIYTIGLFDGADEEDTGGLLQDHTNQFLNAVSSNYPDATCQDFLGIHNITLNSGDNRGYYKAAKDGSDLASIFEEISESVGTTGVELTAEAELKDIINSDKFTLPEGYSKDDVTVKTAKYTGTANNERQWAVPEAFAGNVTVSDGTVSVSGFSYEDNYVVDVGGTHQGEKLIVTIPGVEAKPAAVTGMKVYTNAAASGVYDGETPVGQFPRPAVTISQKSYALDYAAPVTVDSGDWGFDQILHVATDMSAITAGADGKPAYTTSLNGDLHYGSVNVTEGGDRVTYTPTADTWDGVDSIYVFGKDKDDPDDYKWLRVNFVPANNVYYENNFESYTTSQAPGGGPYGYDQSYAGYTGDSGNPAQKLIPGNEVEFTFTGTGVDVYTRTTSRTGTVYAALEKNGTTIKRVIVDNLAVSDNYYQIPSVTFTGLTYGTYTVTLKATAAVGDRTEYYFDGYRVYQPADEDDNIVAEIYGADSELNSQFISVRNILLNNDQALDMTSTFGDQGESAVFIDQMPDGSNETTEIESYEDYGPKNEVYLAKGQFVVIDVSKYADYGKDDIHFYLGLKSPTGKATTVTVYGTGDSGAMVGANGTIAHTSDMYYEVTPADGKITVTNTGNAILSITKLRVAFSADSPYYNEGEGYKPMLFAMNMRDVVDFLSYLEEYVEVTETIVPVQDGNVVELEPVTPEEPVIPEEPVEQPEVPEQPAEPVDPGFTVDPEQQPTEQPEQQPGETQEPTEQPEEQPGETQEPEEQPEQQPGETQEPTEQPEQQPGETEQQPETGVVATKPGNVVELPPQTVEEAPEQESEQTPAQPQKTYGEIWAEQKKQMELQEKEG
ncbi:VWA domain-containing protein [uncultured Oscillibacter sp.]|uniref:VWA domain-containing protein n=1 Tax=uncultured Oscillibacter sp. TaxID=876091 RepID=UPI0025F2CF04|nr:VWA domain-containing protein [uncultured Oscillibacter sp.]